MHWYTGNTCIPDAHGVNDELTPVQIKGIGAQGREGKLIKLAPVLNAPSCQPPRALYPTFKLFKKDIDAARNLNIQNFGNLNFAEGGHRFLLNFNC